MPVDSQSMPMLSFQESSGPDTPHTNTLAHRPDTKGSPAAFLVVLQRDGLFITR